MPPRIPGISFSDALRWFRALGWRRVRQGGSHLQLKHPNLPRVTLSLPDRRGDVAPSILGGEVEKAGLTAAQFHSLAGSGRPRNTRQIRREVYGLEN